MNKIEPKFKVGDKVTNISGLYPEVAPTISEVDVENQCYRYKEIGGVTHFKEQDKLKLVEPEPKFKVGDRVKGVPENPTKEYVINRVDVENQCYGYFNGGCMTKFKDQDKLILVKSDNCRPPVEDDTKIASSVKLNSSIIPADELRANRFIYDEYTLFVQEMMCAIKYAANEGHTKLHFSIGEKDISVFKLGQEFTDAGYKVSAVISNDRSSTIDIEW